MGIYGDQKKTHYHYHHKDFQDNRKKKQNINPGLKVLLSSGKTAIPLLAGAVQVKIGLLIVSITILGMVQPLWVSTLLSLLGSMSCMMGGFMIYNTVTGLQSHKSLISRAIQRVINSQN